MDVNDPSGKSFLYQVWKVLWQAIYRYGSQVHTQVDTPLAPELPTHPYLTVRKLAGSTDVCVYFSKYGQIFSKKYGNHVNECEFIASKVDR